MPPIDHRHRCRASRQRRSLPLRLTPVNAASFQRLHELLACPVPGRSGTLPLLDEQAFVIELNTLLRALRDDPRHTQAWEIKVGKCTVGAVAVLSCHAGHGDFGYMVQPQWQGRGVGGKAALEALRQLQLARSLRRLSTLSLVAAHGSNAILQRCGFHLLGRWRHAREPRGEDPGYWEWSRTLCRPARRKNLNLSWRTPDQRRPFSP